MRLSNDNLVILRELIMDLYSRPFDDALILDTSNGLCRAIDAHYSSFYLFAPLKDSRPVYIISNNPAEFMPVYFSVAHEDYLLDSVITTHREYVVSRMQHYSLPRNRNFMRSVQRARPISDMVYSPLEVRGDLVGFWSMGRAGLKSPTYTDDQLEIFRFVKTFLHDAFKRSLLPPPPEENTAYLDYRGHMVDSGKRILGVLHALFGHGGIVESQSFHDGAKALFDEAYRRFIQGPLRVGFDRLKLPSPRGDYSFLFKLLRPQGPPLRNDGLPYASVSLLSEFPERNLGAVLNLPALSRRYGFTPRECEVIVGIYSGLSNKAIARELVIDESTVKRHSYNIYRKSGFRTRVELVLGLPKVQ